MDFVGQKLAEDVLRISLSFFVVLGFITGFYYQSLTVTYSIIAVGLVITALVTVPSWSIFRKNPVNWRPVVAKKQI